MGDNLTGCVKINMKEIMKENPNISQKKALKQAFNSCKILLENYKKNER